MRRLRFVRCNEFHMRIIDRWVTVAYHNSEEVTFYNNLGLLWNNLEHIRVLLHGLTVVGFYLDTDIMEVRPSKRGMGYGRIIVERMINNAIRGRVQILEFEILPSAVDFWIKMGFHVHLKKVFYARKELRRTEHGQ